MASKNLFVPALSPWISEKASCPVSPKNLSCLLPPNKPAFALIRSIPAARAFSGYWPNRVRVLEVVLTMCVSGFERGTVNPNFIDSV